MSPDNPNREADTERKILEAAAKVFMMKGKLGASMQDIADEAGINRTLLHYYFRSKDKLFDTVFDSIFMELFPVVTGIMVSDRPFPERLELFVEAYTKLLKDKPYLPVFVFQEISLNPERMSGFVQGSGFNPQETLGMLKKELEEQGFPGIDPRHILANLMGMVLFPFIGRPIFQAVAFQDDAEAYDQFLEERSKHISGFLKLAFAAAGRDKNQF